MNVCTAAVIGTQPGYETRGATGELCTWAALVGNKGEEDPYGGVEFNFYPPGNPIMAERGVAARAGRGYGRFASACDVGTIREVTVDTVSFVFSVPTR